MVKVARLLDMLMIYECIVISDMRDANSLRDSKCRQKYILLLLLLMPNSSHSDHCSLLFVPCTTYGFILYCIILHAQNQQRELTMRHAKDTEKEMQKRLDVQKAEYEEAIKRHISFIDQVITSVVCDLVMCLVNNCSLMYVLLVPQHI